MKLVEGLEAFLFRNNSGHGILMNTKGLSGADPPFLNLDAVVVKG